VIFAIAIGVRSALRHNRTSEVNGLLAQRDYPAAVARIRGSGWMLARATQEQLLDTAFEGWREKAQTEAAGGKRAEALQTLRELLQAEPPARDKDEAGGQCERVLGQRVEELVAKDDFPAALAELDRPAGDVELPRAERDKLRNTVATAWTNKAATLLKSGSYPAAEQAASELLAK